MDPANWKLEDIFEIHCPACGAAVEFWKDDVKRTCSCGRVSFNPRLGDICLSWCDGAEECLGNKDISEWKDERSRGACDGQPGGKA
jgi:hypothetical protein